MQEFKVSIVVVPNVFICLAEPPDFGNIRVMVFLWTQEIYCRPSMLRRGRSRCTDRSLHGSVGLDRRIVELLKVFISFFVVQIALQNDG